jgi:hypothetical protein
MISVSSKYRPAPREESIYPKENGARSSTWQVVDLF